MMLILRGLLISLSVGTLLVGRVEADPVVAFSNLPNPGNFTPGGSTLDDHNWKALLFTTPASSRADIVSVQVALGSINCGPTPSSSCIYPTSGDLQVALYSVTNIAGVPTPDSELQSLIMQSVPLATAATLATFLVPNWELAANTTYALVLKSNAVNPLKWTRVEVGGNGAYIQPAPQNGFSFSSLASATRSSPPYDWVSINVNNNGVTLNVILYPLVPTLSEWAQMLLGLMVLSMIVWHFRTQGLN